MEEIRYTHRKMWQWMRRSTPVEKAARQTRTKRGDSRGTPRRRTPTGRRRLKYGDPPRWRPTIAGGGEKGGDPPRWRSQTCRGEGVRLRLPPASMTRFRNRVTRAFIWIQTESTRNRNRKPPGLNFFLWNYHSSKKMNIYFLLLLNILI